MTGTLWYTYAWIGWAVLTLITFGVIEGLAMHRKNRDSDGEPDTLTSHIQSLTAKTWARDLGAGLLVGFCGWFLFHLWGP